MIHRFLWQEQYVDEDHYERWCSHIERRKQKYVYAEKYLYQCHFVTSNNTGTDR